MDGLFSQVYFSVLRQSLQKLNFQLILLRGRILLGLGEFIHDLWLTFFGFSQLILEKIFGVISFNDNKSNIVAKIPKNMYNILVLSEKVSTSI